MRVNVIAAVVIITAMFAGQVAAQGTVGLAWDAAEYAAGYRVQVGAATGATTSTTDVGAATTARIDFPSPGTFYVRVVSYAGEAESGPSNELTISIAPPPPPAAVDCQVSAWSLASVTPWGACTAGSQTRTETWTRTITTQPANGGLACPALSETRTASQACVMPPPNDPCVSAPLVVTFSTWPNKRNAASYTASHDLASVTWLTRKGNQIYGAAFVDIRGCQTTVLK
jgi:hypothetical protein